MLSNVERCKRHYEKMKELHRCNQCGEQDERTIAGKTRCEFCSKKQKLWYRENKLRKNKREGRK